MEWSIKSLSKSSQATGKAFSPGERVVCLLFKDAEGNLQRFDLGEDEFSSPSVPKSLLGKWFRMVKDKPDAEDNSLKTKNTEELFLSLFESSAVEDEHKDILKQIIALYLERKRVLRRVASKNLPPSTIEYLYAPTKTTYLVPMHNLPPETLIKIEKDLNLLLWS